MDFKLVRKGYSPHQVKDYAKRIASELKKLEEELAKRDEDLKALKYKLERAQNIDDEILTEHLGASAARLINTARKEAAAKEIEAAAEAEEIRSQARNEAEEIRSQAETAFKERMEAARTEAERLETEAKSVRHKILKEMSRRRKEIIVEIERLRAGRNRLMDSFEASQKVILDVKEDLSHSLGEAKVVANRAAQKVMSKPEPTPEELEEEIAAAKLLGFPESSFRPRLRPPVSAPPLSSAPSSTPPAAPPPRAPVAKPRAPVAKAPPVVSSPGSVKSTSPKVRTSPKPAITDRPAITDMPAVADAPKTKHTPAPVQDLPSRDLPASDTKSTSSVSKPTPDSHSLFERLKVEQTIQKSKIDKAKTQQSPKKSPSKTPEPEDIKLEKEDKDSQIIKEAENIAKKAGEEKQQAIAEEASEEFKKEAQAAKEIENGAEIKNGINESLNELSRTLERQLKQAIAFDQNQVLDSLRQRRKKEMPPVETQTAAYLETINIAELEQAAGKNIDQLEQLILEYWVSPLRSSLEECFKDKEGGDPQIEVRNSFRDFKQNECSKIATAMARRILN